MAEVKREKSDLAGLLDEAGDEYTSKDKELLALKEQLAQFKVHYYVVATY